MLDVSSTLVDDPILLRWDASNPYFTTFWMGPSSMSLCFFDSVRSTTLYLRLIPVGYKVNLLMPKDALQKESLIVWSSSSCPYLSASRVDSSEWASVFENYIICVLSACIIVCKGIVCRSKNLVGFSLCYYECVWFRILVVYIGFFTNWDYFMHQRE